MENVKKQQKEPEEKYQGEVNPNSHTDWETEKLQKLQTGKLAKNEETINEGECVLFKGTVNMTRCLQTTCHAASTFENVLVLTLQYCKTEVGNLSKFWHILLKTLHLGFY